MVPVHTPRHRFRRVLYFFPFQLLVLHVKKNQLLLLFWLMLFGYITGGLGAKYGIPYLFLFPEYFGHISFWSFAITGFALGGFITAVNLYCYTMHAYRFPFIATIARPFFKFSINNALIPVLFTITYVISSARLQQAKELIPAVDIALNLLGFLSGMALFLLMSYLYFTRTNTDITKLTGHKPEEYQPEEPEQDILGPLLITPQVKQQQRRATRWLRREQRTKKWKVETYMSHPFKVALARGSSHYDKEMLRSVLWQNHINGSIFEVALIVTYITMGVFSDMPLFEIPAAASVFVFTTMLLMLFSALNSWFKGWTITVLLLVGVVVNMVSLRSQGLFSDAQAFGLDYQAKPATYTLEALDTMAADTSAAPRDAREMLLTLTRWEQQQLARDPSQKPMMVLVNTSGGGLRAMLWTFRCLQVADSLLDGSLMPRTTLITGSSGGLIGASYYRALYGASLHTDTIDPNDAHLLDDLSNDMLNPIAFTFVSNDMFIRYRRVEDGLRRYTMDRGHAFERRLNENTHGVLDQRLSDAVDDEREARVPKLVISPTSINDGRRLVITARPSAYLTDAAPQGMVEAASQPESIEFLRFFAHNDPGNLKLTSALRMSSTFPYITPLVTLPSEPAMRVMDAGMRDNYGYRTSIQFLFTFRDWIAEHTRGVVILQMRDTQRELDVKEATTTLWSRLLDPVGSVYGNLVRVQDQDYDLMLQQASGWARFPMHQIDLQLRHSGSDEISLSWHLTALEKLHVLRTIGSDENQKAFEHLRALVLGPPPMITAGGTAPALPSGRAAQP